MFYFHKFYFILCINLEVKWCKYQILGIEAKWVNSLYEESVVDKFKSNLLLMIFWLNIINYNS